MLNQVTNSVCFSLWWLVASCIAVVDLNFVGIAVEDHAFACDCICTLVGLGIDGEGDGIGFRVKVCAACS